MKKNLIQEKQKRDTRDFLLNYKNRTGEVTAHEAELEKLINEENERQWNKRMEVWKREEVDIYYFKYIYIYRLQ